MIRIEVSYQNPFMKKPRNFVMQEETMQEAKDYVAACFAEGPDDLLSVEYFDKDQREAEIAQMFKSKEPENGI